MQESPLRMMRVAAQHFDAKYVDLLFRDDAAPLVIAIWCAMNGRFRRFTVENVSDLQRAGHDFYVCDLAGATHGIYLVGPSPDAHLHTCATGEGRNALLDLPNWGRYGHSAGHSARPPPFAR